jgi:hypothetical protein
MDMNATFATRPDRQTIGADFEHTKTVAAVFRIQDRRALTPVEANEFGHG